GGAAESAPRRGSRCALLAHPEESSGRWCSVLPLILAHLAQLAQVAFVIWCTSARCVSLCRMRRVTVTQLRADKPGQSDHSFSAEVHRARRSAGAVPTVRSKGLPGERNPACLVSYGKTWVKLAARRRPRQVRMLGMRQARGQLRSG